MFCPDSIVWGNVGTWVGAIGTFFAVVVALSVALGELLRRRKQERREQAEKIAGWMRYSSSVTRPVVQISDAERQETDRTVTRYMANIGGVNNSEGVIYGVAFVLAIKDSADSAVDVLVDALGPGHWALDEVALPDDFAGDNVELSIYFTDQKGVSWQRQPNGQLIETKEQRQSPEGPNRRWRTIPIPLTAKGM